MVDETEHLRSCLRDIKDIAGKAWTRQGDHTTDVFGDLASIAENALAWNPSKR